MDVGQDETVSGWTLLTGEMGCPPRPKGLAWVLPAGPSSADTAAGDCSVSTKVSPRPSTPETLEEPLRMGPGHCLGQQTVVQVVWPLLQVYHKLCTETRFHGPLWELRQLGEESMVGRGVDRPGTSGCRHLTVTHYMAAVRSLK